MLKDNAMIKNCNNIITCTRLLSVFILLCACALFVPVKSNAQAFDVDFDLKVIHTDSLNLPNNTISKYVISLLPELLERPGDALINEYDIMIDGLSVGAAVDGVLTQLRVSEIEKIEINESPISSYYNNGQSGSINFILRKKTNPDKSIWGGVSTDVSMPFDILSKFTIGYEKPKFMARTLAFCDISNSTSKRDFSSYSNGELLYNDHSETNEKRFSDLARLYMTYKPTDKNEWQLNFSQVTLRDNATITNNHDVATEQTTNNKNTILRTHLKYIHNFTPRSKFTGELQYVYNPSSLIYEKFSIREKTNEHNLAGMMEYELKMLPLTSKNTANITFGMKFNNQFRNEDIQYGIDKHYDRSFNPYIISKNRFGRFGIKAQADIQLYHYDFSLHNNVAYNKFVTAITGKIMTEYHLTKSQSLRLILDRKISRPSYMEICPENTADEPAMPMYGDPNLNNMQTHEVCLDYLASHRWDSQTLFFNAGASYINISDIIRIKSVDGNIPYSTFYNNGKNNIINFNLMTHYSYKRFSLSATANIFHNHMKLENKLDHHYYHNLSIISAFTTANGWQTAVRLLYNSKVKTTNTTEGSNCTLSFNLGKTWGNLNIHTFGIVSLTGKSHNVVYSNNRQDRTESNYFLRHNAIGVGFDYKF